MASTDTDGSAESLCRIAAAEPEKFEIAAINYRDVDLDYMVYMLKYDTVFGRFNGTLGKYEDGDESGIVINGQEDPCPVRYGTDSMGKI